MLAGRIGLARAEAQRLVGTQSDRRNARRADGRGARRRPVGVTGAFRECGQMIIPAKALLLLMVVGLAAACSEEDTWSGKVGVGEMWRGVVIAPEDRCAPYERSDYAYDSRLLEAALLRELGGVYGPYTGRCFGDRRKTDVEHVIALSEAHDSGMCKRPLEDKARFASDLLNLTLAAPEVNREEKRHYDAAVWLPEKNACWFAARVLSVRRKYGLTIDEAEADALEDVLSACVSTDLVRYCTP